LLPGYFAGNCYWTDPHRRKEAVRSSRPQEEKNTKKFPRGGGGGRIKTIGS